MGLTQTEIHSKNQPEGLNFADCEAKVKVKLKIWNGLYDWSSGSSNPPSALSDVEKLTKGAVTVANLNDTNGNKIPDASDQSVTASQVGRNEIDLMKLVIQQPIPNKGGEVELKVNSGQIELWESSTKGNKIQTSSPNTYKFPTADLDKTVYIEAIDHSTSIRDIEIELIYRGKSDKVKATAIWCDLVNIYKVRGNNDFTTHVPDGLPNNPVPDIDFNTDSERGITNIINNKKADDNSRYGFGPYADNSFSGDCNFGGRILFEFQPYPTDIKLNDLGVFFDVGRKRSSAVFNYADGKTSSITSSGNIPFEPQIEDCNDDYSPSEIGNPDEDRTLEPDSKNFYSYDGPATPYTIDCNPNYSYVVYESDFFEFVRIDIDQSGVNPFGGNTDNIIGSQCSVFVPWNINFTVKRGLKTNSTRNPYTPSSHEMQIVSNKQSHSFPLMTQGSGNGNININVSASATTKGYTLLLNSNFWYLYEHNNPTPVATSTSFSTGNVTLNVPNELSMTINNGTQPFTNGTTLFFNVYSNSTSPVNQLN